MGWGEVAVTVGGINLVVLMRVAFNTGRIVQQVTDIDRRLTRVERKVDHDAGSGR